jgi:hypothetical protein
VSRPLSLAGVAVGAAGVAASLAALYLGMRELMVENGGSCASGGPYQVAPGHACDGRSWVLFVAPFVGLALTALLVSASDAWSDSRISGIGALIWAALFGALGWNFMELGIHPPVTGNPPVEMSGTGAWILCGGLFWAMALGGLVYAGYAMRDYFFTSPSDPAPGSAPPPLVRAAVNVAAAQAPGFAPGALTVQPVAEATGATTAGSPWGWLLTVAVSASAGAGVISVLW